MMSLPFARARLGALAALLLLPLALFAAACDGCGGNPGVAGAGPRLQLSLDKADFGYVIIGQQKELKVTATNTGRGTLNVKAIQRSDGFPAEVRFTPTKFTLEPGQEQVLTLFFQPTEEGERKGTLLFPNDGTDDTWTLDVTGTGVHANLALDPATVDFGPVILEEVGQQTAKLQNNGAFPLDVLVDPMAGDHPEVFRVSVPGPDQRTVHLEAGAAVDLALSFQPAVVGAASALLNVRACTACDPVTLHLAGKGVAAGIVAEPDALDFGSVLPGVKKTLTMNLHNIGNRAITILKCAPAPTAGEFSVQAPPGGWPKLDPGQSIPVQVTYQPTAMGPDQNKLNVATDDSRQPTFDIAVSGYGGGPVADVSPAAMDFGKVAVGFPIARRVFVTNKGLNDPTGTGDDLVLDQIEMPPGGDDFTYTLVGGATLPIRIPPGQRQAIEVRYNPTAVGADASELRLHVNDAQHPVVGVPLKGEGVLVPPCDYELVPAASPGLNFGVVQRGRSSKLSFSVRNIGSDKCIVGKVDLAADQTPAATPAFALGGVQVVPGPACDPSTDTVHLCRPWTLPAGPVYGYELAPGDRLVTEVEFAPPGTAPSGTAFQGAVDVDLSSARAPAQQVGLAGRGAEVCLSITPVGVDFGVVKPLCETNDRKFNIYNACTTNVKVSNIKIGQPSTEYRVLLPSTVNFAAGPVTLKPQDELAFSVRYRPADLGPSTDTVEVYTDQSITSNQPYVLTLAGRGDNNTNTTETFQQANRAKADILFIVDDSGSMSEEQGALGANFQSFMQFAQSQQIDFHIAATTTGTLLGCPGDPVPNGKFVPLNSPNRIITPATPNPSDVFKSNTNVGTDGCSDEKPLEAAYLALSDPNLNGPNAGFLRPDAYLGIIVITDEEDHSPKPVDFYVNYFSNIKGARGANLVSVSGIVGTDPAGCTSAWGDAEYVERVINTAKRTGGVTESICNQNWSTTLQKLGLIAFGYKSRFILGSEPDPTTLHVYIDNVEVPAGPLWSFTPEANAVDFLPTAVPPAGSTIRIEYAVACH